MPFEKHLWRYSCDFGRMGTIASTFFATNEQIEDLKRRSIILFDVLGKHSEIEVDFVDPDALTIIPLEERVRAILYLATGDLVGGWFYPWDYSDEWEDDES